MHISLRQLQIFLAVAQTGSTSGAADAVSLSQSASSAALLELESALQTKLFDRIGKRLLINDSGRLLMPQAHQMLDAAATIQRQFATLEGETLECLRIGASTTIGIYLLPLMLAAASTRETKLFPQVSIANTADIARAVENFEIDLGLVEGPCHQPSLKVEPWISDELVIVAAPDHPLLALMADGRLSLKQLRKARWLLRETGSGTREAVEHALLPHLHAIPAAGEFSNAEAIKHGAAAGLGFACLSRLVVQDFCASGRLVQVPTTLAPLSRHFYLIHHREKILSMRLANFLQFCRNWKAPG